MPNNGFGSGEQQVHQANETMGPAREIRTVLPDKVQDAKWRQLWDRQPRETPEAFTAFVVYKELPPGSPLADATKKLGWLGKGGRPVHSRTIERWAVQFQWRDRKAAWIEYDMQLKEQKSRDAIKERMSAHTGAAQRLLAKGMEILNVVKVVEITNKAGTKMEVVANSGSMKPAVDAIEKAIQLERLGYGMPSQISRIEHELRTTIEISLEVQTRILAVMELHICDECRTRIADELGVLSGIIIEAETQLSRLSTVAGAELPDSGNS